MSRGIAPSVLFPQEHHDGFTLSNRIAGNCVSFPSGTVIGADASEDGIGDRVICDRRTPDSIDTFDAGIINVRYGVAADGVAGCIDDHDAVVRVGRAGVMSLTSLVTAVVAAIKGVVRDDIVLAAGNIDHGGRIACGRTR